MAFTLAESLCQVSHEPPVIHSLSPWGQAQLVFASNPSTISNQNSAIPDLIA